MGLTEEGGKVATGIVENLKNQPLTMALVLFNIFFVIVVYLGTKEQRSINEKLITMLIDNQAKTAEMLFKCAPVQHS